MEGRVLLSFDVTTYPTGSSNYPYPVAVGDFDGDGRPDLAVVNSQNVAVLWNRAPRTPITTISQSATSLVYGQPVTFTATVTAASGPDTLTGIVTFQDGATTLGTAPLDASGQAAFATAALTAQAHTVTAVYSGDGYYFAGSASAAMTLTVARAPLTVTVDSKTMPTGAAPPLTATITGFVLGQDKRVVTGSPALGTTATATSPPGTYPVTVGPGSLAAENYTFTTFVPGTLTVIARPLTVGPQAILTALPGSAPARSRLPPSAMPMPRRRRRPTPPRSTGGTAARRRPAR